MREPLICSLSEELVLEGTYHFVRPFPDIILIWL